MIVFLFGLPGVGKTYLGQLLERELSTHFWDGDEALTDEMKEAIKNEEPFSNQMTLTLTQAIIDKMDALQRDHKDIVIAQAMLLEEDRALFKARFQDIHFIYVYSEQDLTEQRLEERADHVTTSYYQNLLKAFEPHRRAAEIYPSIENSNKSDEQLIEEIMRLLDLRQDVSYPPGFFASLQGNLNSSAMMDTDRPHCP